MEFSLEDLALATVPGKSFDPSKRAFTMDELRPQPIIRKRKKVNKNFRLYNPNIYSSMFHLVLRTTGLQRWKVLGEARQEQRGSKEVSRGSEAQGKSGK